VRDVQRSSAAPMLRMSCRSSVPSPENVTVPSTADASIPASAIAAIAASAAS